jgi:serine/threonine-protein kinase
MGTPYYMSPEQVEGKRAVDFRTDLWAMAVITCECMTGVRPFDGSTFGELLLNICARPIAPPSSQGLMLPGFDGWFAKATSRDSEQRFASAQELASTLGDVVRGTGGHAFAAAAHPAAIPYVPAISGQHSAPSVNTTQALELSTRSHGHSTLPWVLLAVVVLISAGGATALLLGNRPDSVAALASASATAANAAPPAASASVELAPAPGSSPEPAKPSAAKPLAAKPQAPATPAAPPSPATPIKPPVAAAPAVTPAAKTSRCFADPFSGQVRLDSGARPASASTFACKQDPFTGKYKRL